MSNILGTRARIRNGYVIGSGGSANASGIEYDNSTSGLEATTMQGAIDEVNEKVGTKPIGYGTAVDLSTYTSDSPYTATSDGIIMVSVGATSGAYAYIYTNAGIQAFACSNSSNAAAGSQTATAPVFKGMKLWGTKTSVTSGYEKTMFFPYKYE